MSTVLAGISQESYGTDYGPGTLFWRGGLLISHELPGSSRVEVAGAASVDRPGIALRPGGKSWLALQLERYFDGRQTSFTDDLPINLDGWSDFALDVAEVLSSVQYGSTLSYAALASAAGHPNAQRAVGGFLGRNPFPVILPCHRVINSDGSLGGFSSGRHWKTRLLKLEGFLP
jgi:methylated-DNA-[protein]-cysteine S-methyltransferase